MNSYVHIGSADRVVIDNRVLIASGVFISDHNHGTHSGAGQSSPLIPPADRPWQETMVGAASVVTNIEAKNLPEYVIAVGVPAKIIERYDLGAQSWLPAQ